MRMLGQSIGLALKRTSRNIGMVGKDGLDALLGQLFMGVSK